MSEKERKEKYVRTLGGSFWELGSDGLYHKPNTANCIERNDRCIVEASDSIHDLIRPGDLVIFEAGSGRLITKKDMLEQEGGHVSKFLKIKEVYTQGRPQEPFRLEVINFNNLWVIK